MCVVETFMNKSKRLLRSDFPHWCWLWQYFLYLEEPVPPLLHEFFSSGLKDHERCYVPDHELLILHHQMRVEILIRIPFLDRNMSSGIRSSTGTTFAGSRDNLNLRLKRKVKQSIILINNTLDSTRRGIEACLRPLRQQPFQLVLSHRNFVLPGNKRFYQSV